MSTLDLYACVDCDKQDVSLSRMAPKSAAVNYVAPAGAVSAPLSDPIAAIAAENSGPLGRSLLASKLGALAIRDGDDTRVQILFAAKPLKELKGSDTEGNSLKPQRDDATNIVTVKRAE